MPKFKLPSIKVTAFWAGLVMGLGAALIQAYFNIIPRRLMASAWSAIPKTW